MIDITFLISIHKVKNLTLTPFTFKLADQAEASDYLLSAILSKDLCSELLSSILVSIETIQQLETQIP